jgi:hypothetical protein
MLPNQITQEEFGKLPKDVQEWLKADDRYKLNGDTWEVQSPELPKLKKSLDAKDTMLAEQKRQIGELQSTVEKYKDLDPAMAREALARLEELEKKKMVDAGDFERALDAEKTKWEKEVADRDGKLKAEQDFTHKLLVTNGIRKMLTSGRGVDGKEVPKDKGGLLDATEALLTTQYRPSVIRVGEDRKAMVKIDGRERELDEWLPEWLVSDAAKDFVEAPENSGGHDDSRPGSGPKKAPRVVPPSEKSQYIDEIANGDVVVGYD